MTDSRAPLELLNDYARNWSSVGETCGPRCTHKLLDALAAVLDLHSNDRGYCAECVEAPYGDPTNVPYPCPTVNAVTEALEKTA